MKEQHTPDSDHTPQVSTDPQSLPEEGVHKTIIAPDKEKVREADRRRAKDAPPPHGRGDHA